MAARHRFRVVAGLLLLAAAAGGCSGGGGEGSSSASGTAGIKGPTTYNPVQVGSAASRELGRAAPFKAAGELPFVGPHVIKTADVNLQVARDKFHDAFHASQIVAARYGGFVVSSSVAGHRSRSGTVVIRVPADRFEQALGDLEDLGRIQHERISARACATSWPRNAFSCA
jgi:Domain of unknown function (DUF4349)